MPGVRERTGSGRALPPMRRLTATTVLLVLLTLGIPAASSASAGVIRGVVVNESTGEPQGGVELTLTTGSDDGREEVVDVLVSDDRGRYRFASLPTGEDRYYALDARFQGGLFAGRPITLPSDTARPPVVSSRMRVWNTTSEPDVIAIQRDDLFVVADEGGLGVIESVTVVNTSADAYIGRGAGLLGEDASGASVAFALPAGARDVNVFESDLDMPELVPVDAGSAGGASAFAATVAFPPGETRTTFSYGLPGDGGTFDLSRPSLYPTLELSIFAAPPLAIRSNRLEARDGVTLEGTRYERWSTTEAIEAGDVLQAIAVATSSTSAWPLVSVLGGLVVAAGLIALVGRMRARPTAPSPDRNRLLEEVAALDLAYEAGEIERAHWDRRRAALIGRLRRSGGSPVR